MTELWMVGSPCPRCGRIIQADYLGMPIVHLPDECLSMLRIDRDRYRDEKQEWRIEVQRLRIENEQLQNNINLWIEANNAAARLINEQVAEIKQLHARIAELEAAQNERDEALDTLDATLAHREVLHARIIELETAALNLCKELRVTHDNGVIEYDSKEHETMERLLRKPAPGGSA